MAEIKDEWVDNSSLRFTVNVFKNLDKETIRKLKLLVMSSVNERMKVFNPDHIIFIAFKDKKPIGMAMISPFSPMFHFSGETKENGQPYLYNFICMPKYRMLKASVSLMYKVKQYVRTSEFKIANINIDVRNIDLHAERFFRRNGFIKVCNWKSPAEIDYNGFTFFQSKEN